MKILSSKFYMFTAKVSSHIKLILFVATLVLFVLAAGAPQASGSVGG